MDPHIRQPSKPSTRMTRRSSSRTGFETAIRKRFDLPMPEQVSWATDTLEKLEAFEFDDPADRRRYFEAGDNQARLLRADGARREWALPAPSRVPGTGRRGRHEATRGSACLRPVE